MADAPDLGSLQNYVKQYGTVRVEVAEGKGRVLLASTDLSPGELIFVEYPLIHAVMESKVPACKVLKKLKEAGLLDCPAIVCWAALCTLTAEQKAGVKSRFRWAEAAHGVQQQALQLHAPEELCKAPSANTQRLVDAFWEPGQEPDLLLLERLYQVWAHNCFDFGEVGGPEEGALFFAAAMLSHSCSHTAAWCGDESGSYLLRARRFIEEGEEVTLSYLGIHDLSLPVPERRKILWESKGFWCTCERCATRLDSMRGFKCPRCAGTAFGETEGLGIECAACGPLTAEEAAVLLAAEDELKLWARARPHFSEASGDAFDTAMTGADALQRAASGGLAGTHWIVDAARAAAADEDPQRRCELLRLRIEACEAGSDLKVARLRLDLGSALSEEDRAEASKLFAGAAKTFSLLFGDDHPEAQDARERREALKSARRLPRLEGDMGTSSGAPPAGHIRRKPYKRC